MSTINVQDIDDSLELDTPIGKNAYFIYPNGKPDEMFKFCSELDLIGHTWDVVLKNNSRILVLSEVVTHHTEKYGEMKLLKVLALEAMWVPEMCVVFVNE